MSLSAVKKYFSGSRNDVDMTKGSILRHIVEFAIPLLIGNLFQQLYNTVDTWVVGNYVSNEAFSAVGSVSAACNMLIGFFSGLASGAGVVISQYYGAKQFDRVKKAVHTAAALTMILCVLFTVLGILMTPLLLNVMDPPAEVYTEAKTYLTIYFAGLSGLMIYNMGAGILRAVGDSKCPFYFLVVSALVNIVLDLLFVLVFHMGVEGVALATIIAQGISAICTTVALCRYKTAVKLVFRELGLDFGILRKIVGVGLPAALQLAITAFSNVFVQSYINHFGTDCMAGWTAYIKIDQFMFLPMQSLSLAATTFVGQNLGGGSEERAKKGVRVTIILALITTVVIMIPMLLFAPSLISFFNNKQEVVYFGTIIMRYNTPFYVLCCFNQVYASALRGSGNSRTPMITMLCSFVLFRQIYLYLMANYIANEIAPIALAYPAGWALCSLLVFIYYKRVGFKKNTIIEENKAEATA